MSNDMRLVPDPEILLPCVSVTELINYVSILLFSLM